MKYKNLIVNGCSYAQGYAEGGGHQHLAGLLGIPNYIGLGIGGSTNNRIIRTTLKYSYQHPEPTLFVIGLTFLSRAELPILDNNDPFEGRWTNPQNQEFSEKWQHNWTKKDTDLFFEIKLKSEVYSIFDRLDDLQYRVLSMISSLKSRGHGVIVYQQADDLHLPFIDDSNFDELRREKSIIEGLKWRAIPWQHDQGVPVMYDGPTHNPYGEPEQHIRHRKLGEHQKLNQFLVNYIMQNNL
jgi:hypothetical protein